MKFLFLSLFYFLTANGVVHADLEKDLWPEALSSYAKSEDLKTKLDRFIRQTEGSDPRRGLATELLRHLQVTGLQYKSIDDLMRVLNAELKHHENSPLVKLHLEWLVRLLRAMEAEYPQATSVAKALTAVEAVLENKTAVLPVEALAELVKKYLGDHRIERQILEQQLRVSAEDPRFPRLLYAEFQTGNLHDSLRRLLLGQYLHVRSLFTPTIRETREAAKRMSPTGTGSMQLQRVVKVGKQGNFVRGGWAQEADQVRIVIGDMRERVFEQSDDPVPVMNKPQIEREVLLLVDVTSSTDSGTKRGVVRNLIVPSYLDQVFSEAARRQEKLRIHIICYTSVVSQMMSVSSLEEAEKAFHDMANNNLSRASHADHALAMIAGIEKVIESSQSLSHLNVMIVSDGDEPADISGLKAAISRLKAGREGLRLGVSALALVDGSTNLEELTREMAASDNRFGNSLPMMQTFDEKSVQYWAGSDWLKSLSNDMRDPSWRANEKSLARLGEALRNMDLNERVSYQDTYQNGVDQSKPDFFELEGVSKPVESSDAEVEDHTERQQSSDTKETSQSNSTKDSEVREALNRQQEPHNVQVEDFLKDNKVVFRLLRKQGRMPKMLYVAKRGNLPESLFRSVKESLAKREVFSVRLLNSDQSVTLKAEMVAPTLNDGGFAAIAKPDGYRLATLSIKSSGGQAVTGLPVYEITRNGLYVLDLRGSSLKSGETFTYVAGYLPETTLRTRSPLFDRLNAKALLEVSSMLKDDLLTKNGESLKRLATRKGPISVEEVERKLRGDGVYTFNPESNEAAKTSGPFARFQKFLVGDRLSYQCNGAAPLLSDIFNQYAAKASLPNFFAEPVGGYSVVSREVTGQSAHQVTFVMDRRIPFSYLHLDATPTAMDSNAARYLRWRMRLPRLAGFVTDWIDGVIARNRAELVAHYYLRHVENTCEQGLEGKGQNSKSEKAGP